MPKPYSTGLRERQTTGFVLEEILSAMAKQGIRGSRSACQRFFQRHNVSFKKAYTWQSKSEPIARARRRGYESRAA